MKKLNVCCFCEKWGSGGIESFLLNVFEQISMENINIDLICAKKESDFYLPRLTDAGISFREISGSLYSLYKNHRIFRKILKEKHYDVVHLNIYHGLSLLYAADAKRAGVPVRIAHSHGSCLRKSALRPAKLFIHYLAKTFLINNCTMLLACSQSAAGFLFPAGASVLKLVDGIDLKRFSANTQMREKTPALSKGEDRLVICTIGRLCSEKNQAFLLNVMATLIKKLPDALLVFVGEGELHKALERRAKMLKITDNVLFYGVTEDIPSMLAGSDVFVLPSTFEGFGIAAIEAQAAGLPTLCSDGVPPEAVPTSLGIRMPLSAGAEKWAERILRLANEPHRDVGAELAKTEYDIHTTAAHIMKIYCGEELRCPRL